MKACPFCAEDIQDAAIVCKHCGRDLPKPVEASAPRPRRFLLAAIAVGLTLVVLVPFLLTLYVTADDAARRAEAQRTVDGRAEPTTSRSISMSEFAQLKQGMTYYAAVKAIGVSGKEISRSEYGGTKTVVYQWSNPDHSNMSAIFRDGTLSSKDQVGLR